MVLILVNMCTCDVTHVSPILLNSFRLNLRSDIIVTIHAMGHSLGEEHYLCKGAAGEINDTKIHVEYLL